MIFRVYRTSDGSILYDDDDEEDYKDFIPTPRAVRVKGKTEYGHIVPIFVREIGDLDELLAFLEASKTDLVLQKDEIFQLEDGTEVQYTLEIYDSWRE